MAEEQGGWNEYARLVLAELERHNGLLSSINEKLDAIQLQQALNERTIEAVQEEVRDSHTDVKDLKKRVYKLEQGELVSAAIKRYRRWVIAGAFGIVTAIVIPIVEILAKVFGGN